MEYKSVAFALVQPPGTLLSTHLLRNSAEHRLLLAKAKERGLLLYYASVTQQDGSLVADELWHLDDCSLSKKRDQSGRQPATAEVSTALSCPFCGVAMNSTSGRTLHVKTKHPERLAEYLANSK